MVHCTLAFNFSVFQHEVPQNLSEPCKMDPVAIKDAIAELDNVPEDSYKDPTMFRRCTVSDPSLVQMIAPK